MRWRRTYYDPPDAVRYAHSDMWDHTTVRPHPSESERVDFPVRWPLFRSTARKHAVVSPDTWGPHSMSPPLIETRTDG
jgi:hypothetical protein